MSRYGLATATIDAKLLVGHALGFDALQLATRESELVSTLLASDVTALMKRRLTGESVARIIGHKEFYGLDFELNEATLEPRPDTELLVDLALKVLPEGGRFVDMGTGSGCIPIAVLFNRPDVSGVASDINPLALKMARANAERNGVSGRLHLRQGDWFGALIPPPSIPPHKGEGGDGADGSGFDLILSNPPYVKAAAMRRLPDEYRKEPVMALASGEDGLQHTHAILGGAGAHLAPGGLLMVEIGHNRKALEKAYPGVPFEWPRVAAGSGYVFGIVRETLDRML